MSKEDISGTAFSESHGNLFYVYINGLPVFTELVHDIEGIPKPADTRAAAAVQLFISTENEKLEIVDGLSPNGTLRLTRKDDSSYWIECELLQLDSTSKILGYFVIMAEEKEHYCRKSHRQIHFEMQMNREILARSISPEQMN